MKEYKYLLSLFLFLFIRIASFAQVASTFDTNADGWSTIVVSSSATLAPGYINSGGNPDGYISVSLTNPSTPFYFYADRYFDAPAKFLGNKSTSYNQNLTFDLLQSLNGTDLSTAEVILTGAGISVFLPATTAPSTVSWSSYSVLLKETAGWKTGSVAGAATTKTEMKSVLSNLTSLRIKAQYFPGFPAGTYSCQLDNVILNQSAIPVAPVISSFTPTSGIPGTTITINGNNFNTTPAQNVVYFNGVKGTVVSASATQLTVTSPGKISYGHIAVTNLANGAQGTSGQNFNPLFDNNKDFGARVIPSTLAKKVDFGTSTEIGLSVGDLDGDGLMDVLTSSNSLNASVFRNLGQTGSVSATSFSSPLVLSIPNSPVSGAVQRVGQNSIADMDGDGKLDLIVNVGYSCCGGNWDNGFAIFLNQSTPGSLSFASGSIFQFATVNNNNEGIAVVDMDGDGRPELLGAIGNSACALGIAQNLSTPGNLDFTAFQNFGLGATFGGNISFGDLNGDTKPEIILEAYLSGAINVYENTSTAGTISLNTPFLISNVTTSNIEVADMDNDGKNELIFKEYFANQVHIKKNNYASGPLSAGSFSADILLPSSYNTGGNVNEYTAVADVNGDNKPDVVANDGSNVMVYQNNYSSGVLSASSFVGGIAFEGDGNSSNRYVFCADVDGDNKSDILTQPQINFNFRVYRNESYPAPKINSVSPSSANAGTSISLAGNYFNTYSNSPQLRIGGVVTTGTSLSNTSVNTTLPLGIYNLRAQVTLHGLIGYSKPITPTFNGNQIINTTSFSTGVDLPMVNNGNFGLAVADFDNDGKPDIVADDSDVGKVFQNAVSTPGANIVASSFTLSPTTLTGSRRLAAGDLDGDGKIDLVTGLNSLIQNNSTTQPSFLAGVSTNLNNANVILTDHDFNLDGKPDLATVGSSGTQLTIFENLTRNGAFTPPGTNFASFGVGSGGPSSLVITVSGNGFGISSNDFDGDGYDDLAIGLTSTTSSLTVYQNTGLNLPITSAQFAAPVNFTANSSPAQIATADFDGDGKIDAAIGYSTATISVFKNQSTPGTISFAAKQDITAIAGVTTMAAQDLDGDGKPEIITTNSTGGVGSFSVFKNTSAGSISFAAPVTFNLGAGRNPTNLSIADFNLDAKPDLVIRGSGSTINFVTVFQNNIATAPPTITSFSPASGPIGTTVTITGTNFDSTPGNNIVKFNGTTAAVLACSTTSITTLVPPGATTGVITVTVGGNTATSPSVFTVTTLTLTINTQPSDFTACEGDVATFVTAASGTTNIQYQWQFSVDGIVPFGNLSNGGAYSGVTTTTLSISTNGNFGTGRYRCQINGDGVSTVFTNDEGLFLKPLPLAVITANGTQLTASPGDSYQWYQNGDKVQGATNQSFDFNFLEYGLYQVDVTGNGCTSTSAPFEYLITGLEKMNSIFKVYPNPVTSKELFIVCSKGATVTIFDMLGRNLKELTLAEGSTPHAISVHELNSGQYILTIQSQKTTTHVKIKIE